MYLHLIIQWMCLPLIGNPQKSKHSYEIHVYTDSVKHAGTKSNVYFVVGGNKSQTQVRKMDDGERKVVFWHQDNVLHKLDLQIDFYDVHFVIWLKSAFHEFVLTYELKLVNKTHRKYTLSRVWSWFQLKMIPYVFWYVFLKCCLTMSIYTIMQSYCT